ncbi:MAG: protein kinase domain-containing protein [Myxococcota bacterium]
MGSPFTVQINDVTLEPGRVIGGRYTLTEHLGQGGFAQVFKAHDSRIERDVAIKCLNLHSRHTERMGETIIERFEREAKLAAQISHPGVVNIFDYGLLGQSETVPYIVMELLEGWDLDEELRTRGPVPPERALPLFVTCLEALGRAHRKGIVHKDLKPANLFLSNPDERDEALRIVDFGIAHMRSAVENRLTGTGEILGTPQYLAPEYIERQDVAPQLDVYQMGLVLLETLTGEPGVSRDHHLLTLKAHSTGEIDVPIVLMESPLAPVLMKAMALDPQERYADGLEFADALAEVDPETVPAVPRGAPKRRLAGAAAMPAERASAETMPVQSGGGDQSEEKDDTKLVLYVLVAGLAGAVLLAGIAAVALLGQDDGPGVDGPAESATAQPAAEAKDDERAEPTSEKPAEKAEKGGAKQDEKPKSEPPKKIEPKDRGGPPPHAEGKGRDKKQKKDKKGAEKLKKDLEKMKREGKRARDTVKEIEGLLK